VRHKVRSEEIRKRLGTENVVEDIKQYEGNSSNMCKECSRNVCLARHTLIMPQDMA